MSSIHLKCGIVHSLLSLPISQFLPAYPLLQMHSLGRLQYPPTGAAIRELENALHVYGEDKHNGSKSAVGEI